MDPKVAEVLQAVARRLRHLQWMQLLTGGLGSAAVGLAFVRLVGGTDWNTETIDWRTIGAGVLLWVGISWCISRFAGSNVRDLVRLIERTYPDLGQRLFTAIDQTPDKSGHWSFFQKQLAEDILRHHAINRWEYQIVLPGQIRGARGGGLLTILVIGFVCWVPLSAEVNQISNRDNRELPSENASWELQVQPGDVEVERGMGVAVSAEFAGMGIPAEVMLNLRQAENNLQLPMRQNLDDPLFATSIPNINEDSFYRVVGEGFESPEFKITVFEYPRVLRSDAVIDPPTYTGLAPRTIESTVRVPVVEGTLLKWVLYLNKPVTQATLVDGEGEEIVMQIHADDPLRVEAAVTVTKSNQWQLRMVDDRNRPNPLPLTLTAKAIANRPAELKLVTTVDAKVSPLEELPVAAEVSDDFGVQRGGLSFSIDGGPLTEIELTPQAAAESMSPRATSRMEHLVDFEQLGATADQLLTYHFWAEDLGPDGSMRRTTSDLFFAEVRPFEQIFREGQSPDASQQPPQQANSPQAQRAEELAELQKQIAVAAWNLRRTADLKGQPGSKALSEELLPDVALLLQTQTEAIEQLAELVDGLPADRSPDLVQTVQEAMEAAVESFAAAGQQGSQTELAEAARQAQAAYAALLRLRTREFEVAASRQQSGQQGGGAGRSQMQRQLDQLELKNDPRRYESQNSAQGASPPTLEPLQDIASRLRDLARRQNDLNERLKEAELAIQMADTAEQEEAARRQLERLREQQQDLLRDADELGAELGEQARQPNDAQKTATDAVSELEQTRENLRQSAEALDRGEPASALAAGRRAQRELESLREQFDQEVSSEVGRQLEQLQQRVGELAREQKELQTQIENLNVAPTGGGLRADENGRRTLSDRYQEQAKRAENVVEQIRETVRQTEESEPLVAQQLYDAQRRVQEQQLSESLEMAGELLRRGFDPQANEASEIAGQQIEQLEAEIRATANRLLGDPTERMQQASEQLAELARQLSNERVPGAEEPDSQRQDSQSGGSQESGQPVDMAASQASEENRPGEDSDVAGRPSDPAANAEEANSRDEPSPRRDAQETNDTSEAPTQGVAQSGSQSERRSQSDSGAQETQTPEQTSTAEPSSNSESPANVSRSGRQAIESSQAQNAGGQNAGGQNAGGQNAGGQNAGGLLDGFWSEASGSGAGEGRPITGDGFRQWSERLRQVEEMLSDDAMRSRAAGVRDRAREMRRDVLRHAREPQWSEIEDVLARPLRELQEELAAEVLRRSAERNAIVPMERDAVPDAFTDAVRKYYEQLGAGP